jgi:hypothetical protein
VQPNPQESSDASSLAADTPSVPDLVFLDAWLLHGGQCQLFGEFIGCASPIILVIFRKLGLAALEDLAFFFLTPKAATGPFALFWQVKAEANNR